MTIAEWRALLEAYLDGRLSGQAFERRFLDAWRDERDRGIRTPAAIETLFYVVEAYCGDPDLFQQGDADDAELEQAIHIALRDLDARDTRPAASRIAQRTYDRARAREDIGRFQFQIGRFLGFGCAIALAWIGLWLLQIFAVTSQIEAVLDWHPLLITATGVVLALTPILGNVVAFFGATDVWGWQPWLSALVFFAAPVAALISGWARWWRR